MSAVLIGGILVFLKFKASGAHALQQSPIGFIAEFGEVTDSILRLSYRRALVELVLPMTVWLMPYPDFITRPLAVGFLSSHLIFMDDERLAL